MKSPLELPILVHPHMLAYKNDNIREFYEVERNMPYFPPFITTVIALNVFIFFWSIYSFIMNPSDNLLIEGAFQGHWFAKDPSRIITFQFLHAGFWHLFGNMAIFYIAGVMLEHLYGLRRTLLLFVLTGFGACLGTYLYYDYATPTVGASGIVFGFEGALIAFLYHYRKDIFWRHKVIGILLAVLSFQSIVQGMASSYVNNAAHLGGFLVGLGFPYFVKPLFKTGRIDMHSYHKADTVNIIRLRQALLIVFATVILGLFYNKSKDLSSYSNLSFKEQLIDFIAYMRRPKFRKIEPTPFQGFNPFEKKPEMKKEKFDTSKDKSKKLDRVTQQCLNPKPGQGGGGSSGSSGGVGAGSAGASGGSTTGSGGQSEEGYKTCPVCVKGEPCDCPRECQWTYLHRYVDSDCRVKDKTRVWGPGVGSPFGMEFTRNKCIEFLDYYYSWEHPRQGCFAPKD